MGLDGDGEVCIGEAGLYIAGEQGSGAWHGPPLGSREVPKNKRQTDMYIWNGDKHLSPTINIVSVKLS